MNGPPARPRQPGHRSDRAPVVPGWLDAAAQYSWRWLVISAAALSGLWLLSKLRLLFIPFIAAVLIATLLVPPFQFLTARRWPPLLAALTTLLVPVLLLGTVAWVAGPGLAEDFSQLGSALAVGAGEVQRAIGDWIPNLGDDAQRLGERVREEVMQNAPRIATGLVAGASAVAEVIATIILALILLFFFVKDGNHLAAAFAGSLPDRLQQQVRSVGPAIWATLTGYVRGVVVVGAVNAGALGLALLILGIPLVGPLVLLTFLSAFLPLIGALIAGVLAVLVALVSGGPADAVIVAVVVLGVQQLEGDVISPVVFSKALNLHPVVVLAALTAGGLLGGILGAALAVPLVASVASSVSALRNEKDKKLAADETENIENRGQPATEGDDF